MDDLVNLKKVIFENNDISYIRDSMKKCLHNILQTPKIIEISIFFNLLNLLYKEELQLEIKEIKSILNLVRFPMKFQMLSEE